MDEITELVAQQQSWDLNQCAGVKTFHSESLKIKCKWPVSLQKAAVLGLCEWLIEEAINAWTSEL